MKDKALRFPEPIKPGDTIGILAPSFPINEEERNAMITYLESLGYKVKLGETAEKLLNFHNYLAGDAKKRAEDVNRMFADPEVKGIICARGGYGSCHTMEYLDLDMIKKNPKVFIGFSDITNFHSILNKYCGFVTFHGPMLISNMINGLDQYSRDSLHSALHMKEEYVFKNPEDEKLQVIIQGKGKGMITGGNLSLIQRSIGTFYQPDTAGKVLFLEDVDEAIPRLDMFISQLEHAGLLREVRAILLGTFKDCDNSRYQDDYTISQFLKDRFSEYKVPVMANVCSGHTRPMGTIPLGTICSIDTDKDTILFSQN